MTIIVPVITVDGPSGVGKGTLCKKLAKALKWHFLDSGAIYRALALMSIHNQITINSKEALLSLAIHLDVKFKIEHDNLKVVIKGKDVSQDIRSEIVSNTASQIAVLPYVRKVLTQYQYSFRDNPGLIADGRDMGTVVFPDAPVKIFLYASIEERTRRRMQQLRKKGFNVDFNNILSKIKERDNRDYNRNVAPMVPAVNALIIDSTYMNVSEVTAKALVYARQILAIV